ncbi:TetR family transcriptional regulator C-terminal domain-containing protein [uncultured Roseibium sp.]|uniref:TetR family transcriptional regulator C-terminal domain-containing protein n=1 Tax=uncultured Roseibium sp. TaxID=1936171 RepID=UPI003216BD5E
MNKRHKSEKPVRLSRIQEMNRSRIIDAALGEFSRYGYSGATIDKISAAAGMSKSNLLYYFSSKTAVYEAVLEYILDVWLAPLRTLNPDGDPASELAAYIRQKMRMSAERPEASRLFANEVIQGAPQIGDVLEKDLKNLVTEKSKVIEQWIEAGKIRRIVPVHLIFTIWATTQHYADFDSQIRALTGTGLEDPEFFAEAENAVCSLILNGLGLEWPKQQKTS